jgi:hypothetical protein
MMKDQMRTLSEVAIPGLLAGAVLSAILAARGRVDRGSAAAPLNAPTQVVRGQAALEDTRFRPQVTGAGVLINLGGGVFWATAMELLFGRVLRSGGAGTALAAGAATSALAWIVDYHVVPYRLSPGFQERVSRESLLLAHGAFALCLGLGSWAVHRGAD